MSGPVPTREWLRWLDRLPPGVAAAVGAGVGAGVAATLLLANHGAATVALWAGAAGAVLLGVGGRAVETRRRTAERPPDATALDWRASVDPYPDATALDWRAEPADDALDGESLGMMWIPAGRFLMGSPDGDAQKFGDEVPQHPVCVDRFRLGRVPVTEELWTCVMGSLPGRTQGDGHPVVDVSWEQAVDFCNELSDRVGLRRCYDRQGSVVGWDSTADGYRLPAEAEWEHAARAGTVTPRYFPEADIDAYAWYGGNSGEGGRVRPAGQKVPNAAGLHDMLGNVWEWSWDLYGPYTIDEQINPEGLPIVEVPRRVVRGGSASNVPGDLRAADRDGLVPGNWYEFLGFRCARGSRPEH